MLLVLSVVLCFIFVLVNVVLLFGGLVSWLMLWLLYGVSCFVVSGNGKVW